VRRFVFVARSSAREACRCCGCYLADSKVLHMSPVDLVGWWVVVFLAALGLASGAVGIARGSTPTLRERVEAAVPVFGSHSEPLVDAAEFADAVASVPHVSREWAALLLTVAANESALSARIARGECRPLECDHGAAWGLYQQHRNTLNRDTWGSASIDAQTREAARALRSAFYTCNRGALRADWVARTLNAYAGRSCDAVWPGLETRLATFKLASARL
jgi:hypothetical protein